MTQSLSKRKFLAAKLGDRRRDGGNTTSVAAALTRARQARLPSPWTRERDLKWKPEKEAKNSQTRRMTAWKICRLIRLTHCPNRVDIGYRCWPAAPLAWSAASKRCNWAGPRFFGISTGYLPVKQASQKPSRPPFAI